MKEKITWVVACRDVDGYSSRRSYSTLKAACKRFDEMAGHTVERAMEEYWYFLVEAGKPLPAIETVQCVRAVSDFGTVVVLERKVQEVWA